MSEVSEERSVGFLGFGEVGRTLAAGIRAGGSPVSLHAYDPGIALATGKRADISRDEAKRLDVRLADSIEELGTTSLVISAVTPEAAIAAAEEYAPSAVAGQLYVDLNSTSPAVKVAAAEALSRFGGVLVDGALMGGGIRLESYRIPVRLAGVEARQAASTLQGWGLNAEAIGDQVGQAAALKMVRGVVSKGLEGLLVEAMLAATHYGIEQSLLDSLSELFDGWSGLELIENLVGTHVVHCSRRVGELRMIVDTVSRANVVPDMCKATLVLFERSSRLGLEQVFGGEVPKDIRDGIRVMSRLITDSKDLMSAPDTNSDDAIL